jgi:hypothetical protein
VEWWKKYKTGIMECWKNGMMGKEKTGIMEQWNGEGWAQD